MNKMIDHTLLKANSTEENIYKLCLEAKEFAFYSVCVNPCNIEAAKQILNGSGVLVCTVIGFPLGANTTETKVYETKDALLRGADEIDMVINIGEALDHNWQYILGEIRNIKQACGYKVLKVILETCYFTDDEIIKLSQLSQEAGADFIKTSTGFGLEGAKERHIKLMKNATNNEMKIKASGGIKTYEDAKKMVDAGASRLGTSNGIKIMGGDNHGNSTY